MQNKVLILTNQTYGLKYFTLWPLHILVLYRGSSLWIHHVIDKYLSYINVIPLCNVILGSIPKILTTMGKSHFLAFPSRPGIQTMIYGTVGCMHEGYPNTWSTKTFVDVYTLYLCILQMVAKKIPRYFGIYFHKLVLCDFQSSRNSQLYMHSNIFPLAETMTFLPA